MRPVRGFESRAITADAIYVYPRRDNYLPGRDIHINYYVRVYDLVLGNYLIPQADIRHNSLPPYFDMMSAFVRRGATSGSSPCAIA